MTLGHAHPRPIPVDWRDHAACTGTDPDLFFPERGETAKATRAKAICASCPVRQECLDDAVAEDPTWTKPHGIRGGLTPGERRSLRLRTTGR